MKAFKNWRPAALGLSLVTLAALAAPPEELAQRSYVTKPTKLLTEPGNFGEAVAVLEPGVRFEILKYDSTKGWFEIRTSSGRTGWVLMRHTALAGRRSEDVIVSAVGLDGDQPRTPAADGKAVLDGPGPDDATEAAADGSNPSWNPDGVPAKEPADRRRQSRLVEAKASASASARAESRPQSAPPAHALKAVLGATFSQQLNLSGLPGFVIDPRFMYASSSTWSWGVAVPYTFQQMTSKDSTIDTQVRERRSGFALMAQGRWSMNALSVDFGLGPEFRKTAFRTSQISTGNVILTDDNGLSVTGAETNTGLLMLVSPCGRVVSSNNFSLDVCGAYRAHLLLGSMDGTFVGPSGSRWMSRLEFGVLAGWGF